MIKSMTGFGRCEIAEESKKVSVEIKSVNHRYMELGIKMPKKLNVLEGKIRNLLKEYIQRGKIDIFIAYEDRTEGNISLKYNPDIAKEYMDIFNQMSDQFNMPNEITISSLSRYPEVITMDEAKMDEDELWSFIEKAIRNACEQFVETRIIEGEKLKKDMLEKLEEMKNLVSFIEERSPQIMKDYRAKLENKVKELLGDTSIEESRIASEVVIYADKICVDEETVRLKSHIDHATACLKEEGSVGRKLDFIAQEMNREANTILSKADDMEISEKGIQLKTLIEKVREQIQNLE